MRRFLLRTFHRVYRLDRLLRRRFTSAGYLVLASMITAAVVGLNTRLTLASQIFTLLLAVLFIAAMSSLRFRPRLRVQRVLPPFVTAAHPAQYDVLIDNSATTNVHGLRLLDQLSEASPKVADYHRWRDSGDAHRNRFDRAVGYPRWLSLMQHRRGADLPDVAVPSIPAGERARISVGFTPRRRGYLHFDGYYVARPDCLGVWNALRWQAQGDSLLVLPKRYPLRKLDLSGGRLYQPGGVTLAATSGDAQEFVSLRDYRAGDSLRAIHWKSWARAGKPIVKEYRPEYFSRHALVLDSFAQGHSDTVFEEAVSVAASFLCAIDTQDSLLDLMFVGTQAYRFTGGRGLDSTAGLLEVLACVEPSSRPFSELHECVIRNARQFSGCVLVLLGWDEPRQRLVDAMRERSIEPIVLLVTDSPTGDAEALRSAGVTELKTGEIAERLAAL